MEEAALELILRYRDMAQEGLEQSKARLASFGETAQRIGGQFTDFGQKLTLGVTAPLAGIGVVAFKAASDMNESLSKTNVVFGQSAEAILSWSQTTASSLGLGRQEALEAAASFGNMFNTIGLAQQPAADMSQAMVQLAADMASFNNQDPSDMLLRLRSGLAGEAEPLRQFGVLLSESAVTAKALAMGLAESTKELTEADKVQARYALILEQTILQQGDFARTSEGAANSLRIAKAEMADAAATLGQQLLPIGIQIIQWLTGLIEKFNNLSPATQRVIVIVGGLVAALGPVLLVVGQVITVIGSLSGVIGTVGPIIAGLATGPIGILVAAVVGLALAWQTNFLGIQDKTRAAIDAIGRAFDNLRGLLDRLIDFFVGLVERGMTLVEWLSGVPGFVDPVTAAFRLVSEHAGGFVNILRSIVSAGTAVASALGKGNFGKALEIAREALGALIEDLGERFPAFGAVVEAVGRAFSGIAGAVSTIVSLLAQLSKSLGSIKLPSWLTPGSPMPLEIGLQGVAAAMGSVAQASRAMGGGLAMPSLAPAAATAGGGGGRSVTIVLQNPHIYGRDDDFVDWLSREIAGRL